MYLKRDIWVIKKEVFNIKNYWTILEKLVQRCKDDSDRFPRDKKELKKDKFGSEALSQGRDSDLIGEGVISFHRMAEICTGFPRQV